MWWRKFLLDSFSRALFRGRRNRHEPEARNLGAMVARKVGGAVAAGRETVAGAMAALKWK